MTRVAAALGMALFIGVGSAAAQSESVKESFKKTEKGVGELFRGMGQELKKFGGSLTAGTKKGAKKDAKKTEEATK